MKYSIIPQAESLQQTDALICEYGVNLEYNDFFSPAVYNDESKTERLISLYSAMGRDR